MAQFERSVEQATAKLPMLRRLVARSQAIHKGRLQEIKARTLLIVGDRDVPNMMKLVDEAAAKI